ncbi:MAG TPA: hypothetical protein GXZ90_01500, partial [Clostridiales bacterium]|nr:hypothetical protein [Clostridiales bacterium]
MRKNSIKKLSLVLVLAMVISVFAPASGVFAAKGPGLNATKKYLHLGREAEGTNEYNFNIKNKKSGWKYAWTSANTKVAKVNAKNGVAVATGVGTTKVSVKITDKDGKKVDTLKATVIVRDNIAEVAVSNPLAEGKTLVVGQEYDFNRSFVTEAGLTKKTSGVTRWTVEQDGKVVDTATIDEKGVFVADEAGEYTIVARSFQSKAKYNDWVKDNTLDVVTATADTTATVAASILEIKQLDKNSFSVEFDSDMSKTEIAKLETIYRVIAEKELVTGAEKVKEVKLDATGKIATITVYGDFAGDTTYKFKFNGLEGTFGSGKTDVKEIVAIRFKDNPLQVIENATGDKVLDLYKNIEAINSNGVVIYSGTDLVNSLTFEYDDGGKYQGYVYGGKLYMYQAGAEGTIKATFSELVY